MLLIITSTVTDFLDLSTPMTLNKLEPQNRGFKIFFSQFLAAVHISKLDYDEMTADRYWLVYRVWQKSSPLKFFAVFSATVYSFNLKFNSFIY